MEPIGLTVGVVGLASIVSTCIEAFKIVRSIGAFEHDAKLILLKLEIERDLFIQWAYNAGLLKKHYVDASLFNPKRDKVIHDVLEKIEQLLLEAAALARKYGLIPEEAWKTDYDCERNLKEQGWCRCDRHHRRHRHRENIAPPQPAPRKVSLTRKFIWTIHAKDEFRDLINELHFFIERLNQMVRSVEQRRTIIKDLRGVGADFSKLSLIEGGAHGGRFDDWSEVVSMYGDDESEDLEDKPRSRLDRSRGCEKGSKKHKSNVSRSSRGTDGSESPEDRPGRTLGSGEEQHRRGSSHLRPPSYSSLRDGSGSSRSPEKDGRGRTLGSGEEQHRRSSSHLRPPSSSSLHDGGSSARSSRSTLVNMVDEMVGGKQRGRSDLR